MSLQKNLFDHNKSSCHTVAVKLAKEAQQEMLEKVCMKPLPCVKEITAKVFYMAYRMAKKKKPFSNFKDDINVQELNGISMGHVLHSTNACISTVNHTAIKIRNNSVKKL
jgi:hypothetical protein